MIGVADERWGERPLAFVVLGQCRGHRGRAEGVPGGARCPLVGPGAVRVAEDIPRTAPGKVHKVALRARLDKQR